MPQASRNTLSMTVNRTNDFVLNGTTIFAIKGVSCGPTTVCNVNGGNGVAVRPDKFFTLCIPAGAVESRQLLCELSLLGHGSVIKVVFDGTIADDDYITVDQLHVLQIRR